jgi:putative transposase
MPEENQENRGQSPISVNAGGVITVSGNMPRQSRLVLPGVALHIIQRGNNRQACFRGDSDYLLYLLHLRELASRHGCSVHAYCLMTNHVHLLLTPSTDDALSTLMRNLGQRYVQYFNRSYGRSGTLWEGRFRSCIAESARYVLACYRYIELNPVRAGLANHPENYSWSSYRSNVGGRKDPLITAHPEYLALGHDLKMQRQAYRSLFDDALETALLERIREATNGGFPLGSEKFNSEVALARGWKLSPGRPGRPAGEEKCDGEQTLEIGL